MNTGHSVTVCLKAGYIAEFNLMNAGRYVDSYCLETAGYYCLQHPVKGAGGFTAVQWCQMNGNYSASPFTNEDLCIYGPYSTIKTIPSCTYLVYTY